MPAPLPDIVKDAQLITRPDIMKYPGQGSNRMALIALKWDQKSGIIPYSPRQPMTVLTMKELDETCFISSPLRNELGGDRFQSVSREVRR